MCKGRDSGNTWRLSVEMAKASSFLKEEVVVGGERGSSGERLERKEEKGREERRRRRVLASMSMPGERLEWMG